jgi:hypothetical protein
VLSCEVPVTNLTISRLRSTIADKNSGEPADPPGPCVSGRMLSMVRPSWLLAERHASHAQGRNPRARHGIV